MFFSFNCPCLIKCAFKLKHCLQLLFKGEDACGKCGGDNSTCLDCANVPNGPNITDLCGNCKQTSDPTYNVGCGTKLGKLHPLVVAYGNINIGISIPASTLANVVNTTCMFNR